MLNVSTKALHTKRPHLSNLIKGCMFTCLLVTTFVSHADPILDGVGQVIRGTGQDIEKVTNTVGNAVSGRSNATTTNDATIIKQVQEKFAAQPDLSIVTVSSKDGVVTLAGSVKSQNEIDRMKALAQSINGVKSVDTSQLTVQN